MVGAAEHNTPSISVDEHLSRILDSVEPLAPVAMPLAQALGRTLAADVFAQFDVPGFDNSSMDGYAVHRSDLATATDASVRLSVVADIPAGSASNPSLSSGQAARIMTGAPMPDDADCVVPVELTDAGTTTVLISQAPELSTYIRLIGSDIRRGEKVLPAGRTLRATDLAAAAAAGLSELMVRPAPRVGVLSTGDELRLPGESLIRGQIHDSNSVLLVAAIVESGGIPVLIDAVPDDNDLFFESFARAAQDVDMFVTSGGVSVGVYDVVKAVLRPLGVWFGPVRMQPGKPQGFGHWSDGAPIFCLPGNPVSVFVSFEAFVRPAILAIQGRADVRRPLIRAATDTGWRSPSARAQYMPVVLQNDASGPVVRPASGGGSGSHLVTSLADANAFAVVPEDVTEVLEGDTLDILIFGDAVAPKTVRQP